jgi:hypothetical protein
VTSETAVAENRANIAVVLQGRISAPTASLGNEGDADKDKLQPSLGHFNWNSGALAPYYSPDRIAGKVLFRED